MDNLSQSGPASTGTSSAAPAKTSTSQTGSRFWHPTQLLAAAIVCTVGVAAAIYSLRPVGVNGQPGAPGQTGPQANPPRRRQSAQAGPATVRRLGQPRPGHPRLRPGARLLAKVRLLRPAARRSDAPLQLHAAPQGQGLAAGGRGHRRGRPESRPAGHAQVRISMKCPASMDYAAVGHRQDRIQHAAGRGHWQVLA